LRSRRTLSRIRSSRNQSKLRTSAAAVTKQVVKVIPMMMMLTSCRAAPQKLNSQACCMTTNGVSPFGMVDKGDIYVAILFAGEILAKWRDGIEKAVSEDKTILYVRVNSIHSIPPPKKKTIMDGLLSKELRTLLKKLSSLLAEKLERLYSKICGYANAWVSIAMVRATHICLWGSQIPMSQMSNRRPQQWEDEAGLGLFHQ
jgi:hypothetical protein